MPMQQGSELQGISPPPIALTENPEHAEGKLPHLLSAQPGLELLGTWSTRGKNTGKRVLVSTPLSGESEESGT